MLGDVHRDGNIRYGLPHRNGEVVLHTGFERQFLAQRVGGFECSDFEIEHRFVGCDPLRCDDGRKSLDRRSVGHQRAIGCRCLWIRRSRNATRREVHVGGQV